ncbi:predicted protein [Plenodomus lingam JN3]|uniref:Uncharacterized protein n=1 Tax=Leptosphaeria maculans (strain JN3 / isolate v23.1.3 / race Av1-4-5-6-7-8) TaxID=985895 RepID=M1ZIR0_LEPMJ|nr:predicted protein [Plenodomus lingam JN3]
MDQKLSHDGLWQPWCLTAQLSQFASKVQVLGGSWSCVAWDKLYRISFWL